MYDKMWNIENYLLTFLFRKNSSYIIFAVMSRISITVISDKTSTECKFKIKFYGLDDVREDMERSGLCREDAQDRNRWRRTVNRTTG